MLWVDGEFCRKKGQGINRPFLSLSQTDILHTHTTSSILQDYVFYLMGNQVQSGRESWCTIVDVLIDNMFHICQAHDSHAYREVSFPLIVLLVISLLSLSRLFANCVGRPIAVKGLDGRMSAYHDSHDI